MAPVEFEFVTSVVYRLVLVVAGLALAYMAHRLFLDGFFERAGELKTAWGDKGLAAKQAAPGAFFAVVAATMILWSLFKDPPTFPPTPPTANTLPDSVMQIVLKSVCRGSLSQADKDRFITWYIREFRKPCR